MKSVLVCVDPTVPHKKNIQKFCGQIELFQSEGFFTRTTAVSIIHPAMYAVPVKWYQELKTKYVKEAARHIEDICRDCFKFDLVKVIHSDSSVTEDLIHKLSRFGKSHKHDLLVFSTSGKKGLPLWFMGSFSGAASLTAQLPVMILKPHADLSEFSNAPRLTLAIDPDITDHPKAIKWVIDSLKHTTTEVDIVYVRHQKASTKNKQKEILENIQQKFTAHNIKARIHLLNEAKSVAHTIVHFADKRKAWTIVTVNSPGSRFRKLIMGSCARQILELTKRPFLNVRVDN